MEENKEEILEIEENSEGIKISNDVVAVIAGVAVSEVPGVASMSGGFAGGTAGYHGGDAALGQRGQRPDQLFSEENRQSDVQRGCGCDHRYPSPLCAVHFV